MGQTVGELAQYHKDTTRASRYRDIALGLEYPDDDISVVATFPHRQTRLHAREISMAAVLQPAALAALPHLA